MSDTYQAVYDAVRSRFTGQVVQEAMCAAAYAVETAGYEHKRPSAVYRPTLSADGDMWCALLGDDLQIGLAGFGKTPEEAMVNFDIAFLNERTPASRIEARRAETAKTGSVEDESLTAARSGGDAQEQSLSNKDEGR
jgi:hypothetical protein